MMREQFDGMEAQEPGSARLSVNMLAKNLSRLDAARLFYQVCGTSRPAANRAKSASPCFRLDCRCSA